MNRINLIVHRRDAKDAENRLKNYYIKRLKYLHFYECVIIYDASYKFSNFVNLKDYRRLD